MNYLKIYNDYFELKSIDKSVELYNSVKNFRIIFIHEQASNNFIDLKNTEQKIILTNILGLDIFENVKAICFKKYREYITNHLKKYDQDSVFLKSKSLELPRFQQMECKSEH